MPYDVPGSRQYPTPGAPPDTIDISQSSWIGAAGVPGRPLVAIGDRNRIEIGDALDADQFAKRVALIVAPECAALPCRRPSPATELYCLPAAPFHSLRHW